MNRSLIGGFTAKIAIIFLLELSATQRTASPRIALITNDTLDLSPWREQLNIDLINTSRTNLSLFDVLVVAERALGNGEGKEEVKAVIGSGNDVIDGLIEELAEQLTVPFISVSKRSYDMKKNYQVRMTPSLKDRDHVILHLALELGCNHITVFTCHHKLPTFSAEFYSKLKNHESLGLRLVKLPFNKTALAMVKMADEIYQMSNHSSVLMVLDCADQEVSLLVEAANLVSIRLEQLWWLVLRDVAETTEKKVLLPSNVLGIRSVFNRKRSVIDALTALNNSLQQWKSTWKADICETYSTEDQQRRLYRHILMQKFWGQTGWVQFNDQGNRVSAGYDIVRTTISKNLSKGNYWKTVGYAQGFSIKLFTECWIGGESENYSTAIFRVVVIEEEPMLTVSEEGVTTDSECVLSYPCTRYVPRSGSNYSSKGTPFVPFKCCCKGFLIDVLKWLERDLRLRVHIYIVKDGKFGAYNRTTKMWNGMIADLLAHQADMALSTLTITAFRAQFVDFSYPFLYGQTKIIISYRSPKSPSIWEFGFLAPFNFDLWVVFLSAISIMVCIVWALERLSPFGRYHSHGSIGNARNKFNVAACMSFIWANVVKLELESVKPRSFSARFTTAVFSFFTLIIVSSYTANLAASLVSIEDHFPVTGIDDPKFQDPPDGFTFSTLRSSSTLSIFTDSDDPTYRRIGKHMLPHVVKNYNEGIEKLKDGELDAFIYDSPFVDLGVSKMPGCTFRVVGDPIATIPYGVAFPPNSTWRDPITYLLLKYERKDYFRKLTDKWFWGGCLYGKGPKQDAYRMKPANFSGFFLIHCGAAFTCFLILFIEVLCCRAGRIRSYTTDRTT